jgi:tRNA nucleotidyltransferase/poly(A) polymerase
MKNVAKDIVKTLQDAGYEAYFAGGCVRDMLMGVTPKDYDIVTSAKPDEVKKLMPKTVEVGKEFGVIIAQIGKYNFEIATFRSEAEYKDARHPEKVFFTNAHDDARRRDFTINGMFYDPITEKVIDYVDGQKDLKDKIIRFIGNADDRIKEDHLRILRAVRFKNTLGFKYDKRTWEAVCNNAYRIESVSNERIANELNRMFEEKNRAQALMDLSDSGLLKYILPEIEKLKDLPQPKQFHAEGDTFTHTYLAVKSLSEKSSITLVWAVLLHDAGKGPTITFPKLKNDRIRFNSHAHYSAGIATKICRRLKFPNTERDLIVWLVKNHMIIGDIGKMGVAKRRRLMMDPRLPWLLELHKADALGSAPKDLKLYENALKYYDEAKKHYEEEMKKPKFKPFLSGADIIYVFKLDAGPKIGKLLKLAEDAQLEGKIKTKKEALDFVEKNI